jgi:hypothetical protein
MGLLSALPALAAATAEAAWVALAAATVDVLVGRPPALPLWGTLLAAGSGVALARRAVARTGDGPGRGWILGIVLLWGLLGPFLVLAPLELPSLAPAARGGPSAAGPLTGVVTWVIHRFLDPAGWFLGLAAWRGTRHGDPDRDDLVVSGLLTWGTPALALPWLVRAWPTLDPARGEALAAAALVDGIAFVAAGLVAVGLSRLEALHRSLGADWRENRAWLALLVAVVGLGVLLGLPAAVLVGVGAGAVVGVVAGPLAGLLAGPLALLGRIGADFVAFLGALPSGGGPSATTPVPSVGVAPPPAGVPGQATAPWVAPLVLVGLFLAIVAAGLVARRLRGVPADAPAGPPAPREERSLVLPRPGRLHLELQLPRIGRPRRRSPTTAAEAYLAVLALLGADEGLARRPHETPGAHARRLREAGRGSLALDFLAADFVLERYGGVRLGPGEVRRAIGRWVRLRHRFGPGRPGRPGG